MNVNKHFRIVFTPKDPKQYINKRFLVSANQLYKYVTYTNAQEAFNEAFSCPLYKFTIKFRKYGKLEFYSK